MTNSNSNDVDQVWQLMEKIGFAILVTKRS
jgi:hypothetical protein